MIIKLKTLLPHDYTVQFSYERLSSLLKQLHALNLENLSQQYSFTTHFSTQIQGKWNTKTNFNEQGKILPYIRQNCKRQGFFRTPFIKHAGVQCI